jgi:probable addiction module antidote protein
MPTREYKTSNYLQTPEDIAEYLNAVFEDPDSNHQDLMIALRNVAEAMGGISEMARRAGLTRAGLHRALSGKHNPGIETVHKITTACGVRLQFAA